MQQSITNVVYVHILMLLLMASCFGGSEKKVIINSPSLEKCTLIQKNVYGFHHSIFDPFESVYNDFLKSKYEKDLLVRYIGQKPELFRPAILALK